MKEYWLTTFETEHGDFFQDYLTNRSKRFQSLLTDKQFWEDYGRAYKHARDTGKLIIRAKVIEDNKFTLYQIWESEQDRREFDSKVDENYFLDNFKYPFTRNERSITAQEKDALWNKIKSSKVILQVVREDHRETGMFVGDPMKNDPVIQV